MERLFELLSEKRPHQSEGEQVWVTKHIMSKYAHTVHEGNIVIVTDAASRTLFSCHTDTVHSIDGPNEVLFDPGLMLMYKEDNTPLGADDGAGVWLLLEMIDAKVPGTYIFHRGEECGGIGSRWMKANREPMLKGYDRAIAFDRRGDCDVITHQGGFECCSPEFASALSAGLQGSYAPCSRGSFTDTKNYVGLIPECTNVSVGYDREHSSAETLDVEHLMRLRERVLAIDWEALPTVRKPQDVPVYKSYGYDRTRWLDDDDYDIWGAVAAPRRRSQPTAKIVPYVPVDSSVRSKASRARSRVINMIQSNPSTLNNLTFDELSDVAWADPDSLVEAIWSLLKSDKKVRKQDAKTGK